MYLLPPITITDSNLTSNIPEPDTGEVVWLVGSTYNTGDEVISTTTHIKYKSNDDGNIGNDPDAATYDESGISTNWTIYGKSNRYAMFDGIIGTQSTQSSEIEVSFNTNQLINALSVFNISAQTANVTVTDPVAGEVYNRDIEMRDNGQVVDWYSYFTEPIVEKRRFSLWDLPAYINATVTLTFGSTGDVSCGDCVVGKQVNIGSALLGTSNQLLDFNVLQRNAFGGLSPTTDRRFANLTKYNLNIPNNRYLYVKNTMEDLRGVLCVWTGSLTNDKTLTYGYHTDLRTNFNTPAFVDGSFEVEGVI